MTRNDPKQQHSQQDGLATVLPSSISAERSILGAIILDNRAYSEVAGQVAPEDFMLDSHRRIYRHMLELGESSSAIDLVTLAEKLRDRGELETVGGESYLCSLIDGVPDRPSIENYVRIVRDKALSRRLIHAATAVIARVEDQDQPIEQILGDFEEQILGLSAARPGDRDLMSVAEIVKKDFGAVDNLLLQARSTSGLLTHYADLDEMIGGLQKSNLAVIAAGTGVGKSSLALNIAENLLLNDGKAVAIFSLEMSRAELLQRLLCSVGRVDSRKVRNGHTFKEDDKKIMRALERLAETKLRIDDNPNAGLGEMRAQARRMRQTVGALDLIVVDYLQLVPGGGKRYENRTQEVSAITRGLKMLAKELDVPVIALSQLNRDPGKRRAKDKRPQLSDLRESGSIEQDADLVAFIYREEIYKNDPELKGVAEVIVRKHRSGPTGTVKMTFLDYCTRFESLAVQHDLQMSK
jgi:replicative DNA helicase